MDDGRDCALPASFAVRARVAGPVRSYLCDRGTGDARFLFTNRKDLEGLPLAPTHPVTIRSRDGLDLFCYYTLP